MLRHLATFSFSTAFVLAQAPFTIGNLVVVRVGDGAAALSSASTATFLDEYTPAGTLVQSIPMPTVGSGTNQPFTNAGSSTSEGFLNVSANGLYLTLAGYATGPGLAAVPQTAATAVSRVIARVDLSGVIDTSTTMNDGYSGATGTNANIRAAVSVDGNGFWTSGVAATNGGVRYVPLGGTTSVGINAGAPTNTRVVGIYNGQLYTSSASGTYQGVCAVGTGLPTVGPASVSLLPGLPGLPVGAPTPSTYDFWFADPQTLYVADDRTPALVSTSGGGIYKYQLVAGSWTLQYVIQPANGCRGLTGRKFSGTTTLYATTTSGQLVSVVDTGAASTVNVLTTAASNTAFRGVRLLSRPTTLTRLVGGCGASDIIATGTAEIGTDVTTTVLNPQGLPLVGYAVGPFFAPACTCTLFLDPATLLLASGPQHTLSLPNDLTLIGFALSVQGIDFLAPTSCTATPFNLLTLTDGYSMVLQ